MTFNADEFKVIRYNLISSPRPRSCSAEGVEIKERVVKDLASTAITHDKRVTENKEFDVKYLDFPKAFDKIDHGILLHKLMVVGFRG